MYPDVEVLVVTELHSLKEASKWQKRSLRNIDQCTRPQLTFPQAKQVHANTQPLYPSTSSIILKRV
jgi:hypothetical protein